MELPHEISTHTVNNRIKFLAWRRLHGEAGDEDSMRFLNVKLRDFGFSPNYRCTVQNIVVNDFLFPGSVERPRPTATIWIRL